MDSIGAQDLARFSEALERLYQPVALSDFPGHVFEVVSMLVPDVIMSLDQVSKRTGALRHARNFEPADPAAWLAQLAVNLERDHPGVAYLQSGGTEPVLRLSDFVSQRQLRDTALYVENFRDIGIEHQVALVLPAAGYVAGLAINRTVDFSERELTILRLARPHIAQAYANARLFSALQTPGDRAPSNQAKNPAAEPLTPREREVFHWLAQGKRDREIASILGSSHRTIQKHVQRILNKLGVETRSAAAACAKGV